MKKIYIFLGLLVLIVFLVTVRNWQVKNWEGLSTDLQPKLESIEVDQLPGFSSTQDASNYREFIAPDGKFKIKYPTGWFLIKDVETMGTTAPQEWKEKYDFQTLLLAQQFQAEKFTQLIISEGSFNIPVEEIIEEMKKINQEQGLKMEIIKSDVEDNKVVFEARYLMANSPNLYSKEEIMSAMEKTYLIAFISFEKDWQEVKGQADFILSSVQIVQ